MSRVRQPDPPEGGFLFNGRRYQTEAEYEAARAVWRARKRRILDHIAQERGLPAGYYEQDE